MIKVTKIIAALMKRDPKLTRQEAFADVVEEIDAIQDTVGLNLEDAIDLLEYDLAA